MQAEIKKEGSVDVLVITIPVQTPAPSKSGKTLIVAGSAGIQVTSAMVNGKPVKIGLNAFIDK